MALSNYALCEINDVKKDMGIDVLETKQDEVIAALINAYSVAIENHLHKKIINRDLTEKYDGDGTAILWLDYYPINSITELKIDDEVISSDDYYLYEKLGKIILDGLVFTKGYQNVEISYNVGYGASKDTIPTPIRQSCVALVHFYIKRHTIDYSETFDEGFVATLLGTDMPSFVLKWLDSYKKVRV